MMKDKMTIKCRFLKEFPTCKRNKPDLCEFGNLNSPVAFCVDKISKRIRISGRRCDEFVFCNIKIITGIATGIYCIENKEREKKEDESKEDKEKKKEYVDIAKIRNQLQGGAKIIECRLSPSEAFGFMPVLVTSGMPNSYFKKLINNRYRVKFRKITERYYIKHIMVDEPVDKPADKWLSSLSFHSIIIPATNQQGCPTL